MSASPRCIPVCWPRPVRFCSRTSGAPRWRPAHAWRGSRPRTRSPSSPASPRRIPSQEVEMRRVVTGQTDSGKSVFVSDDQIEPIKLSLMPGLEFARVWGGDDTASLPTDGTPPEAPAFFPPERGYRFVFVTIPPEGSGTPPDDLDVAGALA